MRKFEEIIGYEKNSPWDDAFETPTLKILNPICKKREIMIWK